MKVYLLWYATQKGSVSFEYAIYSIVFFDDIVVFCKIELEQAKAIKKKEVLQDYASISG